MVELRGDTLSFTFPEVHPDAVLHVDDFATRVPATWLKRGGAMLPMYQSEALWLNFTSPTGYPFAVKVAAGKINAVTGDAWTDALTRAPQDYSRCRSSRGWTVSAWGGA